MDEGASRRRATGLAILAIAGVFALGAVVVACGDTSGTASSSAPIAVGSLAPSGEPSSEPSNEPSVGPTPSPSVTVTPTATPEPTVTPEPTPTPIPTPTPSPTPSPTPMPVPAALTGRLVSPAVAKRHPIAVMLDDLRPARPQSGLASASVVWHAPAEGGIPRYMAIFQDTLPTDVGPVRSSRYYYIAWAAEWKATYVHAGGSPQAIATLRAKGNGQLVYNIDEFRHGTSFYRLRTRFAPHNLYTFGKTLRKIGRQAGAKDKAYAPAWQFAPDAPLEARPYGGSIAVSYYANKISYKYDRKTNTYLRTVTGEKKQTDAADGRRIAPKNVIVMRMSFGPLNDGSHKNRLEAKVIGSGTAWISTNGKTIKGTWKKTALTKPTRFYDRDGKEVTLTIGQTFIQVMKQSDPVSFKAGSKEPPPSASASPTPTP